MFFFMFYMTTLFSLQFLTVSAIYITIILITDQIGSIYLASSEVGLVADFYNSGWLIAILFYSYLVCLIISVFVSISMPLERAIFYLRIIAVIMGFLTTISIGGVAAFLGMRGVHPPIMVCMDDDNDPDTKCVYNEHPDGDTYFSLLTVAGAGMLSIYFIPFLLRPLDALFNLKKYIIGLLAYLLMMPYYANIFLIYAVCNLHDVSWGNRPENTGENTVAVQKADQEKAKADYQVFRCKFVFWWVCVCCLYCILISIAAAS